MTKRKNMTKGERQLKLENQVKNLEMAVRLSQMLIQQQLGPRLTQAQKDLSELASRQRSLQYTVLAFQEVSDVDMDAVNAKASELQIKDFDEFSARNDEELGLTPADEVGEDSVIVFTTEADGEKGFLRSKQAVSDLAFPQMKEDLLGKKVGDTIEVDIDGVTHNLTLLDIKAKPEEEENGEEAVATDGQQVSTETQTTA